MIETKDIFPSILSANFLDMTAILSQCKSLQIQSIHLDVMDAHFVPNLTFGPPIIKSITTEFPGFYYDAHLMIVNPDAYIEAFEQSGVQALTIHYESQYPVSILETARKIKEKNLEVGIAFNPETSLKPTVLEELMPVIDRVLIMSVHPGFGGQKFIESVLNKVNQVRLIRQKQQRENQVNIQIDGGVNNQTIGLSKEKGVQEFVVGSYLLKGNISDQLKSLITAS